MVARRDLFSCLCGVVFGTGITLMVVYQESLQEVKFWGQITTHHEGDKTGDKAWRTHHSHMYDIADRRESDHVKPNTTKDKNITAEELYKQVRVLCWIMTSPATLQKKAKHVKDTWSKRCNIRLFLSSVEDKNFPAVGLPVTEGQLYEKTKAGYKYVWEHYRHDADWFMKADDDTYVILENLRLLLNDYDPKEALYFGKRYKPFVKEGYMHGGAGYILSKAAVGRYVEGLRYSKCPRGGGIEDVEVGKCMSILGVTAVDTRDEQKLERFHSLTLKDHLMRETPAYHTLLEYNYYPTCSGSNCSSKYPISFHHLQPEEMHVFEYLIYRANVYGVSHIEEVFKTSINESEGSVVRT